MRLDVTFKLLSKKIDVDFKVLDKQFNVDFGEFSVLTIHKDAEYYEGEYKVTPAVVAQTLPTAKRTMKDDMTILAIPYYDVSNQAGGQTVYIGNEV